jgi:Immunity protein 71/Immunity protein 72
MMAHLVPTPLERKQIFYWLKKASSYTAWERDTRYYKAWVEKFDELYQDSQRNPDPVHGTLLPTDKMVTLLDCYAAAEGALARLKRGDKRCFVWLGQNGHFSESYRAVDYWMQATWKGEEGDIEVKAMYSKLWPEVNAARERMVSAGGENGVVLQTRHTDEPANIWYVENDGDGDIRKLCCFPEGDLPEVPIPTKTVLCKTGDIVPAFGIWEPVKADLSPGFVGLFKKPKEPANGKFELDGCMNYLHAGHAAPTIYDEKEEDPAPEGRPTVWRLLWEDDRYLDGVIPEEEKDYVFFAVTDSSPTKTAPLVNSPTITAHTGELVTRSGVWAVMTDLQGRANFAAGDKLPKHKGHAVDWVWVSD